MIQDFEALSDKFDKLIQGDLGKEHLINPYFRISKGTPEQTRKYLLLRLKIPRFMVIVWYLFLFPINTLKIGITLIFSAILFKQNSIFEQKIKDSQVLFLSHGTYGNLADREKDTFFGEIPAAFCKQRNLRCTILYTNQNLFGFRKNNRLLNCKTKEIQHILLPKFIPFFEHVKYVFTINSRAFFALFLSLRYYLDKPDLSRILICSFPWYFSRATYSNYLLLNRIEYAQSNNKLTRIFLTFEGHSYEQLLIDGAKATNENLNVILYQHSPIVPSHYGIKSFLEQLRYSPTVLTTGFFYEKYFQAISNLPIYKVIGTNKGSYLENTRKIKTINKIIYAPEGTNFATAEFIALIKHLITDLTNYSHCLRLHPDLKISVGIKLGIMNLKKHKNFVISENKLDKDLVNAEYLLYRSSAVGIESLKYNLLPIFYANHKFIGLNVLFSNSEAFFKAHNPSEVLDILGTHHNLLSPNQKINLLTSYFSSLNLKILNEV